VHGGGGTARRAAGGGGGRAGTADRWWAWGGRCRWAGETEGEGVPPLGRRERGRGERSYVGVKKMKNTMITMVEAHRRRRSSPEPRGNSLIDCKTKVGSLNQKHRDEALDRAHAAIP
jgi:hypothetical protein